MAQVSSPSDPGGDLRSAGQTGEQAVVPEVDEPVVALKAMTAGQEVVEDYGHVGLTLRNHPVAFLRHDLAQQKVMTCADAAAGRDGRFVKVAGLVLVRQMPGSAKGVMFITIEDETGIANLVIWPALFEKQRWVILSAGMLAVDGRIQREGEVVHIVACRLHDLSNALASVADRDAAFPVPHRRGDEFHHAVPGRDPRDLPPGAIKPRDLYTPDLSRRAIRVRTRDFR